MAISREQGSTFMKRAGKTPEQIEAAIGTRCAKPYSDKGREVHDRKHGYGARKTYSEMIGRNFASNFERLVAERLWRR